MMGLLKPTAKRTGAIFFDTCLCALEGVGASNIVHNGGAGRAGSVIRCTYKDRAYRLDYSPTPAPRKVSNVIDVFRHLGLMSPKTPRPPRRVCPPLGDNAVKPMKRKKKVKPVKELANAA